ncbi:MAG: glycosyltransferase family 87 protein [Candidatus Caenarcaniphilales bacterium]|nr:glycosyltransferase family 87 protein [Candidatus Caenarcaniphilales bacterium]
MPIRAIEQAHNQSIAFGREFMMEKTNSKVFKIFVLGVLCVVALWASFTFCLTLQRGWFFANQRSDRLDFAAYNLAGQILHSKEANKLYDYKFQEQKFKELYAASKDINKKTYKKTFEQKFLNQQDKQFLAKPELNHIYFYNSPNSLWLVYLLSSFDIGFAWFLINVISVFLLGLAVYLAFKDVFKNNFRSQTFWVFLLGLVSLIPLRQALFQGQFSLLVALSFFYYFYFASKQKYLWAGFALSVALLKIHIGLPLLVVVLLFGDFKSSLYAFGFTLVSLGFAYLWIGSEGFVNYFQTFQQLLLPMNNDWYVPELATNNQWAESIKGQILLWFGDSTLSGVFVTCFIGFCLLLIFVILIKSGWLVLGAYRQPLTTPLSGNYPRTPEFSDGTSGQCALREQVPDGTFRLLKIQSLYFCLINLFLFLSFPYLNEHDYCLLISLVLIYVYADPESAGKIVNWFSFGFTLPVLLAYSFLGSYQLVNGYKIHLIFVLALVLAVYLLFTNKMVGKQSRNG